MVWFIICLFQNYLAEGWGGGRRMWCEGRGVIQIQSGNYLQPCLPVHCLRRGLVCSYVAAIPGSLGTSPWSSCRCQWRCRRCRCPWRPCPRDRRTGRGSPPPWCRSGLAGYPGSGTGPGWSSSGSIHNKSKQKSHINIFKKVFAPPPTPILTRSHLPTWKQLAYPYSTFLSRSHRLPLTLVNAKRTYAIKDWKMYLDVGTELCFIHQFLCMWIKWKKVVALWTQSIYVALWTYERIVISVFMMSQKILQCGPSKGVFKKSGEEASLTSHMGRGV